MSSSSSSPLAEGRELKFALAGDGVGREGSPLAEGRELKCGVDDAFANLCGSPLAEGRELKFAGAHRRNQERGVAPRGGA